MVEMIARWKQVHTKLQEELGRIPTLPEIAERMDVPERKVRIIRRAVRAFSAPTQSSPTDGGLSLSDMLPDDKAQTPEETVFHQVESEMLQRLLEALDDREATILRLRYGLADEEPMTLKEIGARIGLTRERVRQLEAEALRKLERVLAEKS
jgi:RNA polymerase primary sigma factor